MKIQPIVPKTRGDKFIQDAVRAWREQGLYPDWLSHLLSYIPYNKLEQCGVWLESIDSLAGSCSFQWDNEPKVEESLRSICKALTAIFHHIGAIPRTKTVEYTFEWVELEPDEYKGEYGSRECVGFSFSFDPQDIHSEFLLSTQMKSLLSEDVEPLAVASIVGIAEPITRLSIPFADKRGLALHFLEMGMSRHQVQVFLRQYLKDPNYDLGVYPVQVSFDREMWRFPDKRKVVMPDGDIGLSHSEFREDEGVAIAQKAGQYDNLLLAVLEVFEEAI